MRLESNPQSAIRTRLSLILYFVLLSGCGKVGEPLPPFIRIPAGAADLSVQQSGNDVVLTWTNPARNVDGSAARDLARALIRSNGETIAEIPVTGPGQPQSYRVSIGLTGLARAYSIQFETADEKLSQISNTVSITPVDVPGPVGRITGLLDQGRIILRWEPPREKPQLADAYSVVRLDSVESPIVVEGREFEDANFEPGETYRYSVTPMRRDAETLIEGTGATQIEILARDTMPPAVPTGLEIAVADTGGFVTWEASEARDLAGYRIFRSDTPNGGFVPIVEKLHLSSAFFDPDYRSGLYYAVSAVDVSGNESEMSVPIRDQTGFVRHLATITGSRVGRRTD